MSNSAARIAEIRQALSSTGKSVSDYSARFAAGQAPEQVKVEGVIAAAAAAREASVGAVLNQDEVFNLLAELTSTCKDLRGRSVGRNLDEASELVQGLDRLAATWQQARKDLERQVEQASEKEKALATDNLKSDIERQVQALNATKLDTESLKEAQERASALERSLAELSSRLAALDESNNVKSRALAAAVARAESAEAAVMELQEKLEAAERAAMAVRSDTAAADVPVQEEPVQELAHSTVPTVLSIATSPAGSTVLGCTLRVMGTSNATYQWIRYNTDGTEELVGGATRQQYAPEPRDLGKKLVCSVTTSPGDPPHLVSTLAAVSDMEGLAALVETAAAKESYEFNCVVVQRNGEMQDRREVHQLEVLHDRVKLKRQGKTRYKESYSDAMQVCGARGGGDAAAQGLFLALSPSLVFMLACESAKQRNAAILLIRRRAAERNTVVLGPKDVPDASTKPALDKIA